MVKKTRSNRSSVGLEPLLPPTRYVPDTPGKAPSVDQTALNASRIMIVEENLRSMDLSLDTKGFYKFSYNNIEIRLDSTRDSGVLISAKIELSIFSNGASSLSIPRDQRVRLVTKIIEVNRKLQNQTKGSAIVGIMTDGAELYYHCHSNQEVEPAPLNFDELEQYNLDFMNILDNCKNELREL